MEENRTLFSKRLEMLRKVNRMTQQEVADYLGITRSAYTYYETSKTKPNFDTIICLAKLFGVSIDYLGGMNNMSDMRIRVADEASEKISFDQTLSGLSREERQIVCRFRLLSADEKEELMAFLDAKVKE